MQLTVCESTRSSTNAAGIELTGVRQELRFFIEQYRQGRRETTELVSIESLNTRKHVTLEAERTKDAVGLVSQKLDRLTALEGAQVDERVRERFLESLKYPRFNQRRNQIDAAYKDTLKWVFVGDNDEKLSDDSGSDEYDDSRENYDSDSNESGEVCEEMESDQGHYSDEKHISDHNNGSDGQHGSRGVLNTDSAGEASWSATSDSNGTDSEEEENRGHGCIWELKWNSFSNWLSSTDAIYWISGKPGSGKTTVVKYILADERTKKYLDIWSPGCAIISHYFWLPGSPMQRNMEGLLSSLLYQLLGNNPSASMQVMSSVSGQKSSYTDWSSVELHSAFRRALDSYESGVCLFLDGIDEIKPDDGTKDGIPEFLDWAIELSQRSKIKLCLASRPDPHILETRLFMYPRLRLQDLNHQDLLAYAEGRVKIPQEAISAEKDDLIRSLADKAKGVFLWLILAIKSVNEGFRNDDSTVTLQERIDCLPRGLESLYKDMWARAGADNPLEYRQTAALYFKLLLGSKHFVSFAINVFDIMLATTCLADRVLHAMADRSKPVSEDDMLQLYGKVERNLKIYCVGLIQMVSAPTYRFPAGCSWYGHVYDRIFPVATRTRLEFIHRTASDFLTDTESGREILGFDTSSDSSIECRILYARLANLALIPQYDSDANLLARNSTTTLDRWRHIDRGFPQNLDRLVAVCEQLADSGRLWLGDYEENLMYICSGSQFLNVTARYGSRDDDDKLISRVKDKSLSENEICSFLSAFIRIDRIPSLFRTCREMLGAGAGPNWRGWSDGDLVPNGETGACGIIQTPWQQLLSTSVNLFVPEARRDMYNRISPPTLAELTSLAEVFLLFVSEGAKLSDPVNLVFRCWGDPRTSPDSGRPLTWRLSSFVWDDSCEHTIFASIPAYMIVKLLTNSVRHTYSALNKEIFPKGCIDLENACESYISSGTCRVLGKSEVQQERPKVYFTWWETTDDAQTRLGSDLMEWLERQILLFKPGIEGDTGSEVTRTDTRQTFQSIWDHESWTLCTREAGRGSVCERLIELGFMMRLEGVVEFHSREELVRKHVLENPQYGGTA